MFCLDIGDISKDVNSEERKFIASEWAELQGQNAPIRAVINGKLTSVAEDFYEYFIRLNIPDGEFIMARLIGEVIGRHQLVEKADEVLEN